MGMKSPMDQRLRAAFGAGAITPEGILGALMRAESPLGPGDILRALGAGPGHKAELRERLRAMALDGLFADPVLQGRLTGVRDLPEVACAVITGFDRNGRPVARFLDPPDGAPEVAPAVHDDPVIFMQPAQPGRPPLYPGQRVLARLKRLRAGRFEGLTLRVLDGGEALLGVVEQADTGAFILRPLSPVGADASRGVWALTGESEALERYRGEVVTARIASGTTGRRLRASVIESLGSADDPRVAISAAMRAHGLPSAFSPEALAEAEAFPPVDGDRAVAEGRTDFRSVGFVTIDGPLSRDFDDAVWAERCDAGFRLLIAIADVAYYVPGGSALDREAQARGVSVYLPDRVIPMLPPRLSDDLCSLRPGEDRLCVVFDIVIDAQGQEHSVWIGRGVMRSRARLTYDAVQACHDGRPVGDAQPHLAPPHAALIETLYAAYDALEHAAQDRGASMLERVERQITLTPEGINPHVTVRPEPRLDSHRLIESFMIAANSAAARRMRESHKVALYRVHPPGTVRRGDSTYPRAASYTPWPGPHAALALDTYAHVTSPIRRYADLVCHRAMVGEWRVEQNLNAKYTLTDTAKLATHLRLAEARASGAAREAEERLVVFHLVSQGAAIQDGHVTGETPYGLLVTLTDTGATGLLADYSLSHDVAMPYLDSDALPDPMAFRSRLSGQEQGIGLSGTWAGTRLRVGASVTVRVLPTSAMASRCRFSLVPVYP